LGRGLLRGGGNWGGVEDVDNMKKVSVGSERMKTHHCQKYLVKIVKRMASIDVK